MSVVRPSEGGSAAAELVLWLGLLTIPVLNVVDVGVYAYQRMQVEAAAGAAVQEAWHVCNPTASTPAFPPVITTCQATAGVVAKMQTAAQSTSLGTNISLPTSAIVEGYYCSNGSGSLVQVGTTGTAASSTSSANLAPPNPNNCSGVVTGSETAPGDYIQATVSYTYTPLFTNVSVTSLLGTSISKTAWVRLN